MLEKFLNYFLEKTFLLNIELVILIMIITKIEDEMNGSKIEYITIEKLYKKRKIRNW